MSDDGEVVGFKPAVVGSGYRFDPDNILEAAKGKGFKTIAIIAQHDDDEIWVSGNANGGETLILMEMAKQKIAFGDEV